MASTNHGFSWRTAARGLAHLCVVLSTACEGAPHPAPATDPALEATGQRIEGTVDLGSTVATDVRVTGRCGQHELRTTTDADGLYALELTGRHLEDCERIVIEYQKTGFLPVYRVVPVPLTDSPFAADVELEQLEVLECGLELCLSESGDTDIHTGGVIARGYQAGSAGDRALDFIPPDMRTEDGELISFLGFQYVELYDRPGELLSELPSIEGCVRISDDGLSWVGDVDAQTPEVDLDWYRYDVQRGAWQVSEERGMLYYKRGNVFTRDELGRCHDVEDDLGRTTRELLPVAREALPDVRVEEHFIEDPCSRSELPELKRVSEYWVCGPLKRQGFYAYGRSAPQKSCYALQVHDPCGEPVQGAEFTARGVEHGFLHHAFTASDGTACIEVMASEAVGDDFDRDGLGGEIFAVDLEVDGGRAGEQRIDFQENARDLGACERPQSCVQLTEELTRCQQ